VRNSLSDGVIRVRSPRLSDVDALHEAALESVREISPWMDWCRPDLPREEIAD
jgi:hypothetical protein